MVDHYFSKESKSKLVIEEFDYDFEGIPLRFQTGSGVFCIGKLDYCSEILIKYCDVKDGQGILDLGCGYGPIGISLLKKFPNLHCEFSDMNKRATMLTKRNLEQNKIDRDRTHVYRGDGYEKLTDQKYDVILLNPPQSAGRGVCNDLIEGAKKFLKPGGSIQIVARHNKGGSTFEKFMTKVYGNCETLAKKSGARVYKSVLEE